MFRLALSRWPAAVLRSGHHASRHLAAASTSNHANIVAEAARVLNTNPELSAQLASQLSAEARDKLVEHIPTPDHSGLTPEQHFMQADVNKDNVVDSKFIQ